MRIWDIGAGFLNDQSLLGEHRELHGIYSIIINGKTGYSRHPETLRWVSSLPALMSRHELLVEEMKLRQFNHHSPLERVADNPEWPNLFIDDPSEQYRLLRDKYVGKKQGRIPLPRNIQELWAAHKYSVMARSPIISKEIGHAVACGKISFSELSAKLVSLMRTPPPQGRLFNALSHMWGYVSGYSNSEPGKLTNRELLSEIQRQSKKNNVTYLMHSTALSELLFWAEDNTPI